MHLKILEDYIAELAKARFDNRHEYIESSAVIARLMDIIIEEERRIPDFVVQGDHCEEDDFWGLWDDDDFDLPPDFEGEDRPIDDPGLERVGVTFSLVGIVKDSDSRRQAMRSFKWTMTVILVGLIGFAVGLMTAP